MNKVLFALMACFSLSTGYAEEGKMENVEKPAFYIVGIECKTSNDPAVGPQQIGQLWSRFFIENVAGRVLNKVSDDVFALYCEYEGDYTKPYTFVIGCQVSSVDQIPEGMVFKVLPSAKYTVYSVEGEYPQSLVKTWGEIWQSDLKRTYSGDFEVYGEKFFTTDSKPVDVYIAIE